MSKSKSHTSKGILRKTTSLKIDIELWKLVKKKCIDLDIEISDYIETIIKEDIGIKKRADG